MTPLSFLDDDGLPPTLQKPRGDEIELFNTMDAVVDVYPEMVGRGFRLDRPTMVAMRHGISLGQIVHMHVFPTVPGDPSFDGDIVSCYGALIYLLAERIKEIPR